MPARSWSSVRGRKPGLTSLNGSPITAMRCSVPSGSFARRYPWWISHHRSRTSVCSGISGMRVCEISSGGSVAARRLVQNSRKVSARHQMSATQCRHGYLYRTSNSPAILSHDLRNRLRRCIPGTYASGLFRRHKHSSSVSKSACSWWRACAGSECRGAGNPRSKCPWRAG